MLKRDQPERRDAGSPHDRIAELEQQLSLAQTTIENLREQTHKQDSQAGSVSEDPANSSVYAPRDAAGMAAWYECFPGRNPNPVLRVAEQGTVIYRNRAAADMSGWSAAVDTPVSEFLLPLVSASLKQGTAIERELEIADSTYWVYVVPLPGTGYANVYGRNITARRRAEQELQASGDELTRLNDALEERNAALELERGRMCEALMQQNHQQGELLDAILQVDPGGIAVFTNRDKRFQFVNPAYRAMLPIPGIEPVGKTIQEVWPDSLGFKVEQSYLGPSQGSGPVTLERVTRRFPDGAIRHFRLHVDPLTWHGQPATLVVAWEITQLEEAKARAEEYTQKLQRSNAELEDFALMASHDLQEPLRKIETFGDLVNQKATGLDERSREYVGRMRSAASRMRMMVEALLQLSRVTTQGRPFERVSLSDVAAGVLSDLNFSIQKSRASVEVEPLPEIDGDPLQLRELIQNLVSNSLKYHAPGGAPRVKLTGRRAQGSVELRVSDQGIGFEQEHAERIFQPFQRLVGRSQYEGSGIGLAICRRIVERHHGTIRATGKPGEGATFIVTLPEHQPVGTEKHPAQDASDA